MDEISDEVILAGILFDVLSFYRDLNPNRRVEIFIKNLSKEMIKGLGATRTEKILRRALDGLA